MQTPDAPDFFSPLVFEARRFVLETSKNAAFSVVSAGAERTAAGYAIDRKSFPYLGIEFVAAGRGKLRLGGAGVELGPGMFFCYDRSVPHHISTEPNERMVKYFVDLTGPAARALLSRTRVKPGTWGRSRVPDRVVALFDELVRAGLDGGDNAQQLCRALVEAIVWRLADRHAGASGASSAAFENYLRCRRELDRCSREVNSIDVLAERCGVTSSYLCRLFKRFDSATPLKRLTRQRVAHAAGMLGEGLSVRQVAQKLGYANAFHFSRQFRSVYGVPPSRLGRSTS